MSFIAYSLASALQGQHVLQQRTERLLEQSRERDTASEQLLQTQLDLLEEEILNPGIENIDLRLLRARAQEVSLGRGLSTRDAAQVARIRVTYLLGLKNTQN